MGRYGGYYSKRQIAEEFTKDSINEDSLVYNKTLKHCWKGNNLWCAHRRELSPLAKKLEELPKEELVRIATDQDSKGKAAAYILKEGNLKDFVKPMEFITLVKCTKESGGTWLMKVLDESAGPYTVNCPLSYVEMTEENKPGDEYSNKWRELVREYWKEKRKNNPAKGQRWSWGRDGEIQITSVKPLRCRVIKAGGTKAVPGAVYSLKRTQLEGRRLLGG